MPTIDRTSIITGPALVTFGGQSFWSKGDITLKPVTNNFKIPTSSFGDVDERTQDKSIEVSFEPDGRFTSGLAAVLWPYAATAIGASIFGGSDSALVVHSRAGTKVTVHNAALTKMPDLRLGVAKTIQGSVTFTGLLANSTDPTNAAAYYTIATESYPGDTGFDIADIKTLAYGSAWGSSPWDSFLTQEGWDISFDLQLAPQMVDGLGTVDMSLQSLGVTARAIPVGLTEAQILTAMGNTRALGASVASADDLIVSATGLYFSLSKAGLRAAELGYGAQRKRAGQLEWFATRTVTAGVADPLFYLGTAAPE